MLDEMMGGMLLPRTTDDGTARGQRALVVTAVLTGLSIVIVAMRMYARVGLMKLTGREDYMILISLVRTLIGVSEFSLGKCRTLTLVACRCYHARTSVLLLLVSRGHPPVT